MVGRMRDARSFATPPEQWLRWAQHLHGAVFVWRRWLSQAPDWDHDHCTFCYACICDHREQLPHLRAKHAERGCYRHAFHTDHDGASTWVCRICFKCLRGEAAWTIASRLSESYPVAGQGRRH